MYGLDSEFVNYIKHKVYECKLKNKRGLLINCHWYNEKERVKEIIWVIKAGMKVCLVTDAGTPCLSDPGSYLVNTAILNNILIHSLPGPSAISLSLTSSGFPADAYTFGGYLAKNWNLMEKSLKALKETKETFVLFENKHRLLHTLMNLEKIFGKNQMVYVGVEFTKLHEWHLRGTIENVLDTLNKNPDYTVPSLKGEISIVVAPYRSQYNSELKPKSYEFKNEDQ